MTIILMNSAVGIDVIFLTEEGTEEEWSKRIRKVDRRYEAIHEWHHGKGHKPRDLSDAELEAQKGSLADLVIFHYPELKMVTKWATYNF